MAKWGNALGGWRKQPRSKGGQFSSKGGSKSKAKSSPRKKGPSRKKSGVNPKATQYGVLVDNATGKTARTKIEYTYEQKRSVRRHTIAGAAAGSVVPGIGTAIGAVAGYEVGRRRKKNYGYMSVY